MPEGFIIGVDDTDSPRGLCTTYIASELIREFRDFDLIGLPRLVRLNPNIPWKTRGNGAIALSFGRGRGPSMPAGWLDGAPAIARPRSGPCSVDIEEILRRADRVVLAHSSPEPRTNPAVLVGKSRPPERLYRRAVRELVRTREVEEALLSRPGQWVWSAHNGRRGLVGASAAAAWRARRRTYELLAYRERSRWGTPRRVDPLSVLRMDGAFRTTFNNIDTRNGHIAIAPHSPCPVLIGIRAVAPDELEAAALAVDTGERMDRYLIFISNQGTDDHLQRMRVRELQPYVSPIISGVVSRPPRTERGGHVFFSVSDGTGVLECAAYEPTKEFRAVVRALAPGDRVEVAGGIHRRPFTLNLEKLRVIRCARVLVARKPSCRYCGGAMASRGRGAGFRCRRCGARADPGLATAVPQERLLRAGIYEVPKCARRHLSRPVER
ncbi:MAG: TiaS agmantine-binding domain-containing protein [Thermoplasmatota archaeon]